MNNRRHNISSVISKDLNKARLLHLARLIGSIGIDPNGKSVLEVGTGVSDYTEFWLKRGARIAVTDAHQENIAVIKERFPDAKAFALNLDTPSETIDVSQHSIVHTSGALNCLRNPARAIAFLAGKCEELMLVEIAVAGSDASTIAFINEDGDGPSISNRAVTCLPTRMWVFNELRKHFTYVYQPSYQPDHQDFPTKWRADSRSSALAGCTTFIASRSPLTAGTFFPRVLDNQTRQIKRDGAVKPGLDNFLSGVGFGLVLDVGANQGQFARKLRQLGYEGPIASFEPMAVAFARLQALATKDAGISAFHFALGARAERRDIFISGNSASSSFLPIEDMTVDAEPLTAVVGKETVEIRRLDEVAKETFAIAQSGPVLLKLDTQGTERQVLEGAGAALRKVDYILSECSLVSVYQGEPLAETQIAWMRNKGFDPIAVESGWSDPKTGQTYQIDILFKRR